MIYVDTREKKWNHIKDYFDSKNIEYELKKLDYADYCNSLTPDILIDRKRNLLELAGNMCTRDKIRFWKEMRESYKQRKKMIIVIEQGRNYKTLEDVKKWKSEYTHITGRLLYNEMLRLHIAYNVDFYFCTTHSSGKVILELLGAKNE